MPQRRNIKSLSFISDQTLRRKIEEAIEINSFLYLMERDGKFAVGVSKEIRRTIILYSASIIEAILLYLYKRKNFSILKQVYFDVHYLPEFYQSVSDAKLVIAKQGKKERNEAELMLDVLVKFFSEEKIIKDSLRSKIDFTKNIRNTFHLSKSRKGLNCGIKSVNISTDAVLDTILVVRDYLNKNP